MCAVTPVVTVFIFNRPGPKAGPIHGIDVSVCVCALGSGETSWNSQKIGAEPDLVAFYI